jgi:DNA-directed RNA polymerase specialized sigma24 family protein
LERLSDEELIRRYCADTPDREAGEKLASRCLQKIRKTVRREAFDKCPSWYDREAFAGDAESHAIERFLRGICSFGFKGKFHGWLATLATRAAEDERRRLGGRGISGPRTHVLLDERELDGDLLDAGARRAAREEARKLAGKTKGAARAQRRRKPRPKEKTLVDRIVDLDPHFRSKYWKSPWDLVRDREFRELGTEILTLYAQRSRETQACARIIRRRVWDGWTVERIAQVRQVTDRTVWRILAHNFKDLRELLAGRFRISTPREVL